MLPLGDKTGKPNTGFIEATTQTVPLAAANTEPVRHTTSPVGMEGEN